MSSRSGLPEAWEPEAETDQRAQAYDDAVARAVRDPRGQAFLRSLLQSLERMPDQRLAEGWHGDACYCAIGIALLERGVDVREIVTAYMAEMDAQSPEDFWEVEEELNEWIVDTACDAIDAPKALLQEIIRLNDAPNINIKSEADRYRYMTRWLDKRVKR